MKTSLVVNNPVENLKSQLINAVKIIIFAHCERFNGAVISVCTHTKNMKFINCLN